jgi:Flp pilus assembly protein TadB
VSEATHSAAANVRAAITLSLAVFGLINVIDGLGDPWSALITTLLMTQLALAFLGAARHTHHKRFSWLLSASAAAGLAIAECYNLVNTAPVAWAVVVVTFIVVGLLVVRRRTHRRLHRFPRPVREVPAQKDTAATATNG